MSRRVTLQPGGSSSTVSNPAIARLVAYEEERAKQRAAWLEANKPRLLYRGHDFGAISDAALPSYHSSDLHWLTWHYVRDTFFDPSPNTTWRDYAAEAASHNAGEGFRHLADLAFEGSAEAVVALATYTLHMVETLTTLAKTQRNAVMHFSRKQWHWPVLKSFHPHFDVDHKKLLEELKVGESNPLNIYKGKWNLNDEIGKVA
jgi:hypothetical protein